MASYVELSGLFNDADLIARCNVAVVVAAEAVKDAAIDGTPDGTGLNTSDHRLWARYVLDAPKLEGRKVLALLLADNKNSTVAQIQGVTDATLQTLINALVPYLVQARADR